ncbi:hypothetical protein D3C86_1439810 [compost metagenome]
MAKPPAAFTSADNLISVPRPAMFVAIVTTPGFPASSTICASCLCIFAFNTLCVTPLIFSIRLNNSEISTDVVPIRTGLPACDNCVTSSITALNFSRVVL